MTVMIPPPPDALQSLLGRHWHHLPATEVGQLLETDLDTGLVVLAVVEIHKWLSSERKQRA